MATRTTDVRVRVGADMAELQKRFADGQLTAERFAAQMDKVQARMQALGAEEAKAARENIEFNRAREASVRQMATVEAAAYAEQKRMDEARVASMAKVGTAFAGLGVAVGLGLAVATKAAMDWQTAFANVEKVVGTGAGTDVLEQQLRHLATVLPATSTEIANVATSAGQLGVAKGNIADFTKVAIELGSTTSLSAEDAATGLAKLGNVMDRQGFAANIDRAGSALLALGNYGASTEAEILDMAQRISGAGKVIGLSEADVLGFANALTSVGVNAEEGGTAISKTMEHISQAVQTGGKSLDAFAVIAGKSATDFAAEFRSKPTAAITDFIGGLQRIQQSGGNVFNALASVGLNAALVRDTLLRAEAATSLLTSSVDLSSKSWSENTALVSAANAKYETAAAKVAIARNNLNDAAISIGQSLLPVVAGAATQVAALARAFDSLSPSAKSTVVNLGSVAAVTLTASGAALMLIPKLGNAADALEKIGGRAATAANGIRAIASAALPVSLALAAGTLALGYFLQKQAEAKARVDELTASLDQQTGAITEDTKVTLYHQLAQSGAVDSAKKLGVSLSDLTDAAAGNKDKIDLVNAALDRASSTMSTGYVSGAKAAGRATGEMQGDINNVRDAIGGANSRLRQSQQALKDQKDATQNAATAQANAVPSFDKLTGQMVDQKTAAADAATAVDNFSKALKALYDEELGLAASKDTVQSDLNSVTSAYKQATTGPAAGGKSKSEVSAEAKAAGDAARVKAAGEGMTRAQASALAKQAADAVRAGAKSGGSTTVGVDVAKGATDAAISVRNALRKVVEDSLSELADMAKHGVDPALIDAEAKRLEAVVEKTGRSIGLRGADLQAYTDAFKQVPDTVSTNFATPGLAAANADLATLVQQIGIINGTPVKLQVDANAGNVRENRTAVQQQSGPGFFQQNQQPLSPQVVVVPVSSTHTTAQTVHVGKVVAKDPTVFLSRRFGANGVG